MIKALVALCTFPVVGILISSYIYGELAGDAALRVEELKLLFSQVCVNSYSEYRGACDQVSNINLLQTASYGAFLVSFLIVFLYWLSARYCGTDRQKLVAVFPILVPVILFGVGVQVAMQGAIVTYGTYILEAFLIGRVHFILIGGIGLGAILATFAVFHAMLKMYKAANHFQIGQVATEEENPELWGFVNSIAQDIGAVCPDHIILGVEPTFYVTAATVSGSSEEPLHGETLYLSLPLLRLLDSDELKAIVAHELGHFKGEDTAYSLKFAPVYRGLANSIAGLAGDEGGGSTQIAALPAITVLGSMYETFDLRVAEVNRIREFEADNVAVLATSEEHFSYALTKVSMFAFVWSEVTQHNLTRLSRRKVDANLSHVFEEEVKYSFSLDEVKRIAEMVLARSINHPTDSHPTLSNRLSNVGFEKTDIDFSRLTKFSSCVSDLVPEFEKIEEELTLLNNQIAIQLGHVVIPEEEQSSSFANVLYVLGAAMVGADGKIERDEMALAQKAGISLTNDFDKVDFRLYCKNLEAIPDLVETAESLNDLDMEIKEAFFTYVKNIAEADGEVADEERALLQNVADVWGLSE